MNEETQSLGWDLPAPAAGRLNADGTPFAPAYSSPGRKAMAASIAGTHIPHAGKESAAEVWREAVREHTDTVEMFMDTLNRQERRRFAAKARRAAKANRYSLASTIRDVRETIEAAAAERARVRKANELLVSL